MKEWGQGVKGACVNTWCGGAYGGGADSETDAEVSYLSVGPDRLVL